MGAGGMGKSSLMVMFIQGTFLAKVTPNFQIVSNPLSLSPLGKLWGRGLVVKTFVNCDTSPQ
jgi:GTPase SAR1 family protein